MTPGCSVGFGRGDRPVALGSHGHSKGITGRAAEAAAQHTAGLVKPTCSRREHTGTLTDPRPTAVGFLGKDASDPDP